MKQHDVGVAKRGLGSLLVLALLLLFTSCRAVRAGKLDERIDEIENRVTAIEAELRVQRASD